MRVLTSMGWRDHWGGTDCWCQPEVQQCGCGTHPVYIHKDVTISVDSKPRLTVFTR